MTITILSTRGDLLQSDAVALVNPVNTQGVMGKGLALQFKRAFPDNFEYMCCNTNSLPRPIMPGDVIGYKVLNGTKWVLNLATKQHWRNPSRLIWIENGIRNLLDFISRNGVPQITSIAIPMIGCGNGGLSWENEVRPVIMKVLYDDDNNTILYQRFYQLHDLTVFLYEL